MVEPKSCQNLGSAVSVVVEVKEGDIYGVVALVEFDDGTSNSEQLIKDLSTFDLSQYFKRLFQISSKESPSRRFS